jgi:DNA-binding transcriptional ArsR family regulator
MERRFLEECLARRLSLEAIGELAGKHPSTVGYWLAKYGLEAAGHAVHAPKGRMDEDRLRALVEKGASIRQIADELSLGYSTVRHWLKRLGLETERSVRRKESDAARCVGLQRAYLRCRKHGHTTFFKRSDGGFRCAKCSGAAVSKRRREVKRQLVEEAGGRCRICGFCAHPAALQFHHRDPTVKEFHLGHQGLTRSIARMRAEARKCVLLCANCHALVEAGVAKVPP